MTTEWRDVVGYEGMYEVSSCGLVRRSCGGRGARAGYVLSFYRDRKGYRRVTLTRDAIGKRVAVHRLVAEAFIGNGDGLQVNHIDCDKTNNNVANLEWVTGLQNMQHAAANGRMPSQRGERNGGAKLTDAQAEEIRLLAGKEFQRITAERFGISVSRVGQIQCKHRNVFVESGQTICRNCRIALGGDWDEIHARLTRQRPVAERLAA